MKLEYETKSACRIMADLLSDDTDHTVNTIQKEQVDCSIDGGQSPPAGVC